MSEDLISCHYYEAFGTNAWIYVHAGISAAIQRDFAGIPRLAGLTFETIGRNLISCNTYAVPQQIHKHSGITETILYSFNSPSTSPSGLAYDGTNLISCDVVAYTIYVHEGISSTILEHFGSPNIEPYGLTYDVVNLNLVSCDTNAQKIYKHDGISDVVTDEFVSPGSVPMGLTHDGVDLVSCDDDAQKIYKHDGITSTILYSFDSPNTHPHGLAYEPKEEEPEPEPEPEGKPPTDLLCEQETNPTNVGDPKPEFSAIHH